MPRDSGEGRILLGRCNLRRMDRATDEGGTAEDNEEDFEQSGMDKKDRSAGEMDLPTWTGQKCLSLIALYKARPCLWDPNDGYYYDREMKSDKWAAIAQEMNIPVPEIKRKMESLTSSFRREKGKHRRITQSGRVYKSDWFAFKAFNFLMDRKTKTATSNDDNDSDNTLDAEKSTDLQANESTNKVAQSTQMKRKTCEDSMMGQSPKKHKDETNVEGTVVSNNCAIWQTIEEDDPTLMFSKYLGKKLNQFDPRTRATLIHDINQLIYHAEINAIPEEES